MPLSPAHTTVVVSLTIWLATLPGLTLLVGWLPPPSGQSLFCPPFGLQPFLYFQKKNFFFLFTLHLLCSLDSLPLNGIYSFALPSICFLVCFVFEYACLACCPICLVCYPACCPICLVCYPACCPLFLVCYLAGAGLLPHLLGVLPHLCGLAASLTWHATCLCRLAACFFFFLQACCPVCVGWLPYLCRLVTLPV